MVTIQMAMVGDPGNPSVGVVQTFGGPKGNFVDPPKNTGIYKNCSDAPKAPPPCLTVGSVGYTYGIGEFETTVSQYVTFLNTADPRGKNLHNLYNDDMNPVVWPKYGSIRYTPGAATGEHYSVAYPEWAEKPFNFGNFRRGARFANSLTNGKVLSSTPSTAHGFKYVTYTVRLSPQTERGMYDMAQEAVTRAKSTGFVLPSNNEWVKAAYYDPKHGGTDSEVRKIGTSQGGEYLDGIRFTYEGGQIRSLLSLLSYFGKGEMRERSLGIKIPPTNLKPDFDNLAHAFANKLAGSLGPSQQPGEGSSSHASGG